MTERIVTITLGKKPDYMSFPSYWRDKDPLLADFNAASAVLKPSFSELASSKYSAVVSYLLDKHSKGKTNLNHAGYARTKMKVSNGNWLQRKRKGEIVFANYRVGRLRAGFVNRELIPETLTLKCHSWQTTPKLPFQISEFPEQAVAVYSNRRDKNPGLMYSFWWVPGEGVLPDTQWETITQIDERRPYDQDQAEAMLASLNYKNLIDDGLITQTLAEINQKELDLLTEVAEIAKTCATIERSLRAILALLFKFKSSIRYLTGPGASKKAAEIWLEFRYGIRPLIYSVESSLKVLQGLGKTSTYVDARKQKVITRPSPLNRNIKENLTLRCLVRRQYKYSDLIGELGSKFISADPIVTAWELTALSFVVDWVFDIGSFLSAIGTFTPLSFQQNATFSIKAECSGSTSREYLDYNVYTRFVISPETHITVPLQLNLDVYKLMDLTALARTISKDVMDLKKRNNNVH